MGLARESAHGGEFVPILQETFLMLEEQHWICPAQDSFTETKAPLRQGNCGTRSQSILRNGIVTTPHHAFGTVLWRNGSL